MLEKTKSKKQIKPQINQKTLWIGGAAVLLVGGGIAVWMLLDKKKKQAVQQRMTSITSTKPKSSPCSSRQYPLAMGTCHADVAILQKHLKSLGADIGSTGKNRDGIDQIFGAKTQAAALQKLGRKSFNTSDIEGMKKALNYIAS